MPSSLAASNGPSDVATGSVETSIETLTVELFENELRVDGVWSSRSHGRTLGVHDPPARMDKYGQPVTRHETEKAPESWAWITPWRAELGPNRDAEGWRYATSWPVARGNEGNVRNGGNGRNVGNVGNGGNVGRTTWEATRLSWR